jgi:hypothetical protein
MKGIVCRFFKVFKGFEGRGKVFNQDPRFDGIHKEINQIMNRVTKN